MTHVGRMAAVRSNPVSGTVVVNRKKLNAGFDPAAFLAKTGVGRTIVELATNDPAYSQGEPADAIFYVQNGRVKLTVVSHHGKEATIALLGAGEYMGQDCIISGGSARLATAQR
jgi:CRP/FNR family transcriptional regulator, cyclic AMP receptor protein